MTLINNDLDDLREQSRKHLESLEVWLRRLIHDEFTKNYGPDYFEVKLRDGSYLLNSKIRANIRGNIEKNPERYNRAIDAATIEDEIAIICNPKIFDEHFANPLKRAFPLGNEQARETLKRLLEPRNRLSHANPISERQAEQIICYTGDTIDSLKQHYEESGKGHDYVVPMIVRVLDNFGNEYHDTDLRRNRTGRASLDLTDQKILKLRPGDIYKVRVEVDNPDSDSGYSVSWVVPVEGTKEGAEFTLEVTNEHVRADFGVYCQVISDKDWHRCGDVDDSLHIPLKILPPAS